MNMEWSGGCLCGRTRYVLAEEPWDLNDCHCIDCRRSSGAPYVTWGSVRRENWRLTAGEIRKVPHAGRVRGFAACCGTHLLFENDEQAPTVDVTIASLDRPEPFAPRGAIWTEDRLPWVPLNEALPRFSRSARER